MLGSAKPPEVYRLPLQQNSPDLANVAKVLVRMGRLKLLGVVPLSKCCASIACAVRIYAIIDSSAVMQPHSGRSRTTLYAR